MSYRNRKEYKVYKKHTVKTQKAGVCEFCKITAGKDQFVEETKSFKVIKNIFPYTYWDYRRVIEHLMIVPKKHIDTLDDITESEAAEYLQLLGGYESRGYDVFARAPDSVSRSVPHQHMHLIKPEKKPVRFLLYIKRPYLRIKF